MSKTNTGYRNIGNCNSGDGNSGYYNSGDYNSGDCNSGHRNSGYGNSGYYNSGDYNSGDCNSGYYNSGDYNSGDCNSGNCNSGNWNSGNRNSGMFNTDEPKMRLFNKECDYTRTEYEEKFGWKWICPPVTRWVSKDDMTDEEKEQNPDYETTGGCLKTLGYKEAWAIAWGEADQETKDWFLALPNFDPAIFEEITGIDVNAPEDMVEIDGKKWRKSTIKEALRNHVG